jgi:hypothetical protein
LEPPGPISRDCWPIHEAGIGGLINIVGVGCAMLVGTMLT